MKKNCCEGVKTKFCPNCGKRTPVNVQEEILLYLRRLKKNSETSIETLDKRATGKFYTNSTSLPHEQEMKDIQRTKKTCSESLEKYNRWIEWVEKQ